MAIRPWLLDRLRLALLLLVAVALQTAVFSRLTLLGVTADLFVILVVLVAVSRGPVTAAVFGFVAGLVADIVYLDPVGIHTLIYLVTGYVVARYVEEFGLRSAWMVVVLTGLVSLAAQCVYGVFQFVIGPEGSFFYMVRAQIIPAALLDGLLAAPLYMGLVRLHALPEPGAAEPSFR